MDRNSLKRAMWRYDDTEGDKPNTVLSRTHGFHNSGPIAVVLFVFFGFSILLKTLGVEKANSISLAVSLVFVVTWMWLRRRRRKANFDKALMLRKQVSALEEQEFKLRYEEAKMNGQLDRWKKNDDHNDDE